MLQINRVNTKEEYAIAAGLFNQYAVWLGIDLSFQHYAEEIESLEKVYAQDQGGILLALWKDTIAGTVAVREQSADIAELKRMYVLPEFQQLGIGSALLQEALLLAAEKSYKKIRLDTLDHMTAAMNLYRKNGFYEIAAYYHNPEKNAVYFERTLPGK